jgi:hypothetical protein
MLTAAIAAPKISFETFAMISVYESGWLLSYQHAEDWITSITLSWASTTRDEIWPWSNPALGLNASQPPNQNCAEDNDGELLPNDFEQQPNHAEADDKPEREHPDFGLRLSLRRTFSSGYRFKIGWHDLPPPRMT